MNGEEMDLIRVNYDFFGVVVPQGEGEIVFEFNVPRLGLIDTIATMCSVGIILLLIFSLYTIYRNRKKDEREK